MLIEGVRILFATERYIACNNRVTEGDPRAFDFRLTRAASRDEALASSINDVPPRLYFSVATIAVRDDPSVYRCAHGRRRADISRTTLNTNAG